MEVRLRPGWVVSRSKKAKRVTLTYLSLRPLATFLIPISSSLLALLSFMNQASNVMTAATIAAIQ
jgi:hypothetical protein